LVVEVVDGIAMAHRVSRSSTVLGKIYAERVGFARNTEGSV